MVKEKSTRLLRRKPRREGEMSCAFRVQHTAGRQRARGEAAGTDAARSDVT